MESFFLGGGGNLGKKILNCFASRVNPTPPPKKKNNNNNNNKKQQKTLVTAEVAKENFNLYLSYSHALCDILFFFFVNS